MPELLGTTLLVIFYVVFPGVILYLAKVVRPLRDINPIILAYAFGLLVGNLQILPEYAAGVQDLVSSVSVALSIPLLLFTVHTAQWKNLGGKAGLSLFLAVIAISTTVTAGHLIFRNFVPDSASLSGMLMGVYTGGTPNLAAIRAALNVDTSIYLTVHTADLIIGGVYILFVITIAKPLFKIILPETILADHEERMEIRDSQTTYRDVVARRNLPKSIASLLLAMVMVGVSLGIASLFPANAESIVVIVSLTTLAIGASFIPQVRHMPTSFKIGEFIILVFSLVVGSMADLQRMLVASPAILLFVAFAVFVSLSLHLLLCKVFGVDVDTMLITSVSAICSPPFVGMVAISLRNRQVIAAGITTGIIGYAIGNYLGIFTALMLERFL